MAPRPSSPPRALIVIVDDDAAVLGALSFALETEGFDILAFRTAAALFAAPGIAAADCLVIDQNLPDEPGLDLLSRLRGRGDTTPAVMITTDPPRAVRAQAARLHVPVVEKPLLGDQLFAAIRALIAVRNFS
ncbi:MAG: response regulator [Caulobacter sp.]|nr:response regulator [Caulobacter sp.]